MRFKGIKGLKQPKNKEQSHRVAQNKNAKISILLKIHLFSYLIILNDKKNSKTNSIYRKDYQ